MYQMLISVKKIRGGSWEGEKVITLNEGLSENFKKI